MRRARIAVATALALGASFGVVTLVALEGREVVVIRTFDAVGTPRETRTWVADDDGFTWVEAANPDRPFLRDIGGRPDVELRRAGDLQHCHAVALPNPQGHTRIRRLLAQKYGWADWWIGLLTDISSSSAVQLSCR